MKILEVQKLSDEKWLNLYAARFEHGGHEGRWVFASRQSEPHLGRHCDAVIIVATLRQEGQPDRIAVIREFRVPVGGYVYGLPAGLIDPGETVETTVRREIGEETGLEVTAILKITPPLFSSSGMSDEATAMAFVEATAPDGGKPRLEKSEDIEPLFLSREEAAQLCDDASKNLDAKAWMALHLFATTGRIL